MWLNSRLLLLWCACGWFGGSVFLQEPGCSGESSGFWPLGFGTASLTAVAQTVSGWGGWGPQWFGGPSWHTGPCRFPGWREAHIRWSSQLFILPFAAFCGFGQCSSCTRQWCIQSICSPLCLWRRPSGSWAPRQTFQPPKVKIYKNILQDDIA